MAYNQQSAVKRAQKESLIQQELSKLLLQLMLDDSRLKGLFVSRIKLSPDKSICTVFFYAENGQAEVKEKLSLLILYKPSLRTALAQAMPSRYASQLVFKFDDQFEKQKRMDELFDRVKEG